MLAERDQAELELVHVHEALPVHDPELDVDLARDRRKYIESVADWLRGKTSVRLTTTVLAGPVKDALADHIAARTPDLVTMATHGRGGISRAWLGSVAMHVVQHVAVPVLLTRPAEKGTRETQPRNFGKVLVALDASPEGERAIDNALDIAGEKNVQYHLVHVLIPPVYLAPDAYGMLPPINEVDLLANGEKYLSGMAERLEQRGLDVDTRVTWDQNPARGILASAEELNADLIALQTHARRGLERLLLGSVADKVVRGANVPVLVQRPEPEESPS